MAQESDEAVAYLRALKQPFGSQTGTAAAPALEKNPTAVECKAASVRVTYPYLGMGIAFVEMSDVNHSRLTELLATISRPVAIMGPGFISALPTCGPMDTAIAIPDPAAAVRCLMAFFENRHMLMRDDFMKIIAKSQLPPKI